MQRSDSYGYVFMNEDLDIAIAVTEFGEIPIGQE